MLFLIHIFSGFCAQWEFSTHLKWFVLKSPPGISAPQHRSMSPTSSQEKQTIRLNSAKFFSETCECLLLEVSFFLLSSKGVGLGWILYFCQFSNTSWLPCRNISVFLERVDLPPGNYNPSEVIPVFGWWFTKAYPHLIHVHFTGIIPIIRYAMLSNIFPTKQTLHSHHYKHLFDPPKWSYFTYYGWRFFMASQPTPP